MLQLTSWHHEAYSFTGGFNHNGWFLQCLIFNIPNVPIFNLQCAMSNIQYASNKYTKRHIHYSFTGGMNQNMQYAMSDI